MLKQISQNTYLNLLSGLILIVTAGLEIYETLDEFTIGAHHGIAVFGLIQVVKCVPEILHGCKELNEGEEEFHSPL